MDLGPFWKYLGQAQAALDDPLGGALSSTFKAWGEIYRAFIRKRFISFSRGGGDWPPLKLRSLLQRKRNSALRKKVKKAHILNVRVDYGNKSVLHRLNRRSTGDGNRKEGYKSLSGPPKRPKRPKPRKRPKPKVKKPLTDEQREKNKATGIRKRRSTLRKKAAAERAKKGLGPRKAKLKTRLKRAFNRTSKDVAKSSKKLRKSGSKSLKKGLKASRKSLGKMRKMFKASLKSALKGGKGKKSKKSNELKTKANILVDTGTLRNALSPNMDTSKGAFQQSVPGGIKLGWDGGKHPGGKGVTVGKLIMWHNYGMGRLPKRTIIVAPDDATIAKLTNALTRGIRGLGL